MLWTGFEIVINAFQAFMMLYFVRRKFHLVRPQLRYALCAGGAITAFLSMYLLGDIPINDTLVFLIPTCYTFLTSDDPWYVKLFWNVALTVIFIGVTDLIINSFLLLPGASEDVIFSETPLRVMILIGGNLALLFVILVLTRKSAYQDSLSIGAMVLFLFLEGLSYATIELVFAIRLQVQACDQLFIIVSICLLISAVLSLALYEMMTRLAEKKRMYEAEAETMRLTRQHYEEVKNIYAYMMAQQHDLAKQYQVIHGMLSAGHSEKSRTYLEQLGQVAVLEEAYITGCVAVDALLTMKKLAMDQNHITFAFQPYPLHELPISESNFCAILSNLLDNAIEATLSQEDQNAMRSVSLCLARSWDIFFISCENTADTTKIRMKGKQLISTKKDSSHHGYGTRNIQTIVDQAQGDYRYRYDAHSFRTDITLPYPIKKKEAESPGQQRDNLEKI